MIITIQRVRNSDIDTFYLLFHYKSGPFCRESHRFYDLGIRNICQHDLSASSPYQLSVCFCHKHTRIYIYMHLHICICIACAGSHNRRKICGQRIANSCNRIHVITHPAELTSGFLLHTHTHLPINSSTLPCI